MLTRVSTKRTLPSKRRPSEHCEICVSLTQTLPFATSAWIPNCAIPEITQRSMRTVALPTWIPTAPAGPTSVSPRSVTTPAVTSMPVPAATVIPA